jgi:uncharacterized cupin superfamily protein
VRITRWDFAPGAATGWHTTHGWPYFVLMLTDAVMKIEAATGAVSEVKWKAGDCYQRPAGVEHDVLNASDRPLAFVEIEIKRPEELVQCKRFNDHTGRPDRLNEWSRSGREIRPRGALWSGRPRPMAVVHRVSALASH